MPLRDHFRSPVNDRHSCDEVHGGWPMEIVRNLLTILPAGFRAAPRVHLGTSFEVDVGTFDMTDGPNPPASNSNSGDTATLTAPAPTYTIDADLSEYDEYEVRIYDVERGRQLVAVIEIVSPANKDRPDSRDKFVTKCAALLQQEVCVSIVDRVSVRHANLYAELLARLGHTDPNLNPTVPAMYAVTLRGRKPPNGREQLDA